jgi:hypothetical protein
MRQSAKAIFLSGSGPYFAGLLLLAMVTFWPTYVSLPPAANSPYTHFHAAVATLWVLMLITQPILIRSGRLKMHRRLGKVSFALAPIFVLAALLLAHSRIAGLEGPAFAVQTYVLWLQISLTFLFSLSYILGIANRRKMHLHARFMVCTGLTLIDPVVIRLMFWIDHSPTWNYQWLTFGLTDLALIGLMWLEGNEKQGRSVFPVMLAIFVLAQMPAMLGLTDQAWWQAFSRWFARLPIT